MTGSNDVNFSTRQDSAYQESHNNSMVVLNNPASSVSGFVRIKSRESTGKTQDHSIELQSPLNDSSFNIVGTSMPPKAKKWQQKPTLRVSRLNQNQGDSSVRSLKAPNGYSSLTNSHNRSAHELIERNGKAKGDS